MSDEQSALFESHPMDIAGLPRTHRRLILPKYLEAAARDQRLEDSARAAHKIFVRWAELETKGKLAKANESQLEAEFITQIFVEALHYPQRSGGTAAWEFQPKFAVPEGTADAAIGRFGDVENQALCIIELKGPKINVDRDRSRGRTPVQQLWDYLNCLPSCPWGIVCNFLTFRLYHHQHAPQQFEIFTLQELRDFKRFLQFYVLFERNGLLPSTVGETPRAEELLKKTETALKTVGAKLYDDYSKNRLALIDHLVKAKGKALDQAIHIAQKLMDRIVFVAFCKSRRLLPSSCIYEAAHHYSRFDDVTNPRWQNFVKLFRSIDKGNVEADIPAYNGGLFRRDPEVDDFELLADKWTAFFEEIGTYDFETEINVDVLGRIFERSITDLESIRIASADPAIKPAENGKRKREGIFYTPPRITAYDVEQAAGQVLRERFSRLAKLHHISPDMEPSPKTLVNWLAYQNARLDVLRRFRILDPACGSGAFLIAAFVYLDEVYDEVLNALTLRQGFPQEQAEIIKRDIVRNNLFGVDISAESVEITQLALWLHTAERGKPLADLSANIRRGNSLVDDPDVDPLAFGWNREFPDVFADGGFDCVVGNPPYVKLQNFKKYSPAVAAYLPGRYKAASTGNFDLYLPFIERGIELLKPDGTLGFIAPNVWLFNEYGAGLRESVAANRSLAKFDDFKSFQVFDDATTYTALQFFRKSPQAHIDVADVSAGTEHLRTAKRFAVDYPTLGEGAWALLPADQLAILRKMRENSISLEEASSQIFQGIITSADAVYHLIKIGPGHYFSHKLNKVVEIEDTIMKPLISSENPVAFATPEPPIHLLFPYQRAGETVSLIVSKAMKKDYRKAWAYLQANEAVLKGREDKMDHAGWYGFVYPKSLDKQELPKIGVPQTVNRLQAFIDPKGELYFNNVRINGILPRDDGAFSLWFLLGLMNSSALDYCFRLTAKPKDRDYFEANKQFIAPLPVPNIKPKEQKPVELLAKKMTELFEKREALIAKVCRRIATDLTPAQLISDSPLPPSLPGKIRTFYKLESRTLLDTLEEYAKAKFMPAQRDSWERYLSTPISNIQALGNEIAENQTKLDDIVFSLYGLAVTQIATIKNSRQPTG